MRIAMCETRFTTCTPPGKIRALFSLLPAPPLSCSAYLVANLARDLPRVSSASTIMVQTGLGERAAERDIAASDAAIPIVDLALPEHEVVEAMRKACCDIGFFYLAGHGVPSELVEATFAQAARFFKLDTDEKMKIDIHNKSSNFKGYTKMLGENVDPANRGDMHEGFDVGNDAEEDANQWPSDLDGFRAVVNEYW